MKFFKRNKRTVLIVLVLILVLAPFGLKKAYDNRFEIAQNPNVVHFIPLYRSLRKLPDIFTLPLYAFSDTNLESYNLTISPGNIRRLNEALPNDPFGLTPLGEEYKLWVPAEFSAAGYSGNVDVRYRGNLNGHWNSYKKSYLIKFPKENLFNGMREITLIVPKDRRFFTTELNNYRAEKLGFTVPDDYYVNMNINGADHGVYIAFEHWSQEWMEKAQIEPSSVLIGSEDDPSHDGLTFYSEEGIPFWKSWTSEELPPFEFAKAVVEIIEHADDETFEKLIPQVVDVDLFMARDTLSVLSGGYHSANPTLVSNNLVMYFDGIEGRLKPIPYNVSLFEHGDTGQGIGQPTALQRRLWEIPAFQEKRKQIFEDYVVEEKEADLAYFEDWKERMNTEFFRDSAKSDNNITYRNRIAELSEIVEMHFDDPLNMIGSYGEYSLPEIEEKELEFTDSFVYLLETIKTPLEFVRKHRQFFTRGGELFLPAGNHFFNVDIIVPVDTKLTISAGARLHMAEGVSLISYSPVEAKGTASRPIRVIGDRVKNWGSFAVVNAEEDSIIEYVTFENGSDDRINGVYFSGMLSIYNSPGIVASSTFKNAQADDGINVKSAEVEVVYNRFEENSSDAIDVDFGEGETKVSHNVFLNNGGDSIDLSWSDIEVKGNIIVGCPDKGVSVGESSNPFISENTIANCSTGIAVKDSSVATIENNVMIGNNIAYSAYQKKPIFGGGTATVTGDTVWDNIREVREDQLSAIEVIDIERETEPDLSNLPQEVIEIING